MAEMITIMTLCAEHNNKVITLKVKITLKVSKVMTSIFHVSSLTYWQFKFFKIKSPSEKRGGNGLCLSVPQSVRLSDRPSVRFFPSITLSCPLLTFKPLIIFFGNNLAQVISIMIGCAKGNNLVIIPKVKLTRKGQLLKSLHFVSAP
jgi:hypothetical protein